MDKNPQAGEPSVAEATTTPCQLASAGHTTTGNNAPSSASAPPTKSHDYLSRLKDLPRPPAPLVFVLRLAALLLCVDTLLIVSSPSPGAATFLLRGLNCVLGAVLCFRAATRLEISHHALELKQQQEEALALASMRAAPKPLSFNTSPTRSRTRPFLLAMMVEQDRARWGPGAGRHHRRHPSRRRGRGRSSSLGSVGELEREEGEEGKEGGREEEEEEEEILDPNMDYGSGGWGYFNSGEEGGRERAGSSGDANAAAAAAVAAAAAAPATSDGGPPVNCNKKLTLLLCFSAVLLLLDAGWIFWLATTTYLQADPPLPPGVPPSAPPSDSNSLRQHAGQSSNAVYGVLLYVIGLLCVFAACASISAARRLCTYGRLLLEGEKTMEEGGGEEEVEEGGVSVPPSASKCVSFERLEEEEGKSDIVANKKNEVEEEEGKEEGMEVEDEVQCMAIDILDYEEEEEEEEEAGEENLDVPPPQFPPTPSLSASPRPPLPPFSAAAGAGAGAGAAAGAAAVAPRVMPPMGGGVEGLMRRCASFEDQRRLALLLLTTTTAAVAGGSSIIKRSSSGGTSNNNNITNSSMRRCASFVDFRSSGSSSQWAMGGLASPVPARQPSFVYSASSPLSNSSAIDSSSPTMLTPAVMVPMLTPLRV